MANVEITKYAMAHSMQQLMETVPFSKISISDICRQIGMSRKSFYYHFKDKYDMMIWIFNTECFSKCESKASWDKLEYICTYLYKNRTFYAKALSVEGQNSLSEYFAQIMLPHMAYMKEENDGKTPTVFEFYKDALLLSLRKWLTIYKAVTPEAYVLFLKGIFSNLS